VIVTGGNDGIGAEICEQMAKEGFNICIVGRNTLVKDEGADPNAPKKTKNEAVLNKLQQAYPNIKTRAVIADFSNISTVKEY